MKNRDSLESVTSKTFDQLAEKIPGTDVWAFIEDLRTVVETDCGSFLPCQFGLDPSGILNPDIWHKLDLIKTTYVECKEITYVNEKTARAIYDGLMEEGIYDIPSLTEEEINAAAEQGARDAERAREVMIPFQTDGRRYTGI